jgi:hypothetical protein
VQPWFTRTARKALMTSLVGCLGCRRLRIAKFPVFLLRNRQQSASKKEGS